jgi:hypothetical protein
MRSISPHFNSGLAMAVDSVIYEECFVTDVREDTSTPTEMM